MIFEVEFPSTEDIACKEAGGGGGGGGRAGGGKRGIQKVETGRGMNGLALVGKSTADKPAMGYGGSSG